MKMMVILGMLFVLSIQPMLIISSMIFIVLIYAVYLMWNLSSFWFSYMMILVLMSGVLVIFTYMMSVLPNESFEMSSLVLMILSIVLFFKYSGYEEFMGDVSLGSMSIWSGFTTEMSILLVIYLLVMMIIVVWMSMLEKGAIRIF